MTVQWTRVVINNEATNNHHGYLSNSIEFNGTRILSVSAGYFYWASKGRANYRR